MTTEIWFYVCFFGFLGLLWLVNFIMKWIELGNPMCALGLHDYGTSKGWIFKIMTCSKCGNKEME